jgi:hypothetical protein
MLKTLPWRMIAFGCALGVLAGLLAVASELDFPGKICEYNQATKHEDCITYSILPFLLIEVAKTLNDYGVAITALATVLLTFVTGGLVWIGYMQVNTTRAQLRAYVFVSKAKVTNVVDGDGMPEAIIVIKNSGQTPARDLLNVGGFAADRYPPRPTLNLTISDRELSVAKTRISIGPGDISICIIPAGRMLTEPEKASIVNGTGVVYVYGKIRYQDVFGKSAGKRVGRAAISGLFDRIHGPHSNGTLGLYGRV